MTNEIPAAQDLDDARVLNLVRAGDADAFGLLYQRHEQAARRLARELVVSPAEVDDVVAETFARVLDATQGGGGPSDAFRPYVLTAVRRVCYDRLPAQRGQIPTAEQVMPDRGDPFVDTAAASLDGSLIARAFLSLPERWSAVLWHTDIEQGSLSEVTAIFGLTRNGVSALRQHAKDGLRQAYLQMYISRLRRPECEPVAERLGAFVRDALPGRETTRVSAHLSQCEQCQAACSELADVDTALRGVVAPIFLGSAAAPYLASAVHGAAAAGAMMPLVAGDHGGARGGYEAGASAGGSGAAASAGGWRAGASAGDGAIEGAMAGATAAGAEGDLVRASAGPVTGSAATGWAPHSTAAFGPGGLRGASRARHGSRRLRWLAAGTGIVVALFAIAFAVLLTGRSAPAGPVRHDPQAAARLSPGSIATSSQPKARRKTPGSHPASPSPNPAASPTANSNPRPADSSPSASPHPLPSVELAATVNVDGGGNNQVVFRVTDTGSAATGQLTATITLPGGASMTTGGRGQGGTASNGRFGWSCQPTSTGAICTHRGISAGRQTEGTISITLSGTAACGQPVELTVASGSASASAQSPEGIAC